MLFFSPSTELLEGPTRNWVLTCQGGLKDAEIDHLACGGHCLSWSERLSRGVKSEAQQTRTELGAVNTTGFVSLFLIADKLAVLAGLGSLRLVVVRREWLPRLFGSAGSMKTSGHVGPGPQLAAQGQRGPRAQSQTLLRRRVSLWQPGAPAGDGGGVRAPVGG